MLCHPQHLYHKKNHVRSLSISYAWVQGMRVLVPLSCFYRYVQRPRRMKGFWAIWIKPHQSTIAPQLRSSLRYPFVNRWEAGIGEFGEILAVRLRFIDFFSLVVSMAPLCIDACTLPMSSLPLIGPPIPEVSPAPALERFCDIFVWNNILKGIRCFSLIELFLYLLPSLSSLCFTQHKIFFQKLIPHNS